MPEQVATRSRNLLTDSDALSLTGKMASKEWGAFEIYYEHYFEYMFRIASRLTGRDEATCLDIVQEAMLKAFTCARKIAGRRKLDAWTTTVVRSVSYDFLRKEVKRTSVTSTVSSHRDDGQDEHWHFEQLARLEWIEQQIQGADEEFRNIMALRYRLGWKLKRIADYLGVSTGSVDGRIRRYVARLQNEARDHFESLENENHER